VQICLKDLFIRHGIPEHIRSDNGSEFTAKLVRNWLYRLGTKTLFIEPGSPWENGYCESFNGRFRDELLNGEIFDTAWEAKVLVEEWRKTYNTVRPHGSLNYRRPHPGRSSWCGASEHHYALLTCSGLELTIRVAQKQGPIMGNKGITKKQILEISVFRKLIGLALVAVGCYWVPLKFWRCLIQWDKDGG